MPVVSTYQQAVEPTDLTPGITWLRDNGTAAVRKMDLTWNEIGNWELPNFGNVPIQGGTLLGPLLGAHGLAPLVNTPLSGVPTVNGIDLASEQWVTDQLTTQMTTINNLISNAISGTNGNITIGSNLAVGYGTGLAHGGTVPLPTFSDNTRATAGQVWGIIPSINTLNGSEASTLEDHTTTCSVDINLIVTCKWHSPSFGDRTGTINYIVICKR